MRKSLVAVTALALTLVATPSEAQQASRAYTEGTVVVESYIRTKPGMFNAYMDYLKNTWKQTLEAQKQAGLVSDYYVQGTTDSRGPTDYNLVLVTVYPNMAAFDGLEDRAEPINARLLGTMQQRDQAAISREAMRDLVGSRRFRTYTLR